MAKNLTTERTKIKILFVCLGNICRSPAAEGIMKKLIDDNRLTNFIDVDSAGTSGWHEGELPDERMRIHGKRRGYDFCSRSRKINVNDFDEFNYIVVMDDNNYKNVKDVALTDTDIEKIHRITDFSLNYYHDYVPDPYYGGSSGFGLVIDLLEDACSGLLQIIRDKHKI